MSKENLLYIESKIHTGENGPAWIARAQRSKSGRTVYFNNMALKSFKGGRHGNYFNIETNDVYWISGVKERGANRHWAGSGIIMVDSNVLDEFLKLRGAAKLNSNYYKVVSILDTDISRFHDFENV
jgi:hypothetical protein